MSIFIAKLLYNTFCLSVPKAMEKVSWIFIFLNFYHNDFHTLSFSFFFLHLFKATEHLFDSLCHFVNSCFVCFTNYGCCNPCFLITFYLVNICDCKNTGMECRKTYLSNLSVILLETKHMIKKLSYGYGSVATL